MTFRWADRDSLHTCLPAPKYILIWSVLFYVKHTTMRTDTIRLVGIVMATPPPSWKPLSQTDTTDCRARFEKKEQGETKHLLYLKGCRSMQIVEGLLEVPTHS